MIQTLSPVTRLRSVAPNIFVLSFSAAGIAAQIKPGQFINIKINEFGLPFLRRPFSVYRVDGDEIEIIFNVVGLGTTLLSQKRPGDVVDIIGPLGSPYDLAGDFQTALLVGGGLGIAPLPMITSFLTKTKTTLVTFLGARTADQIVPAHLVNIQIATDDGSSGFHGTVVDLLRSELDRERYPAPKLFACGPHPMLSALAALAGDRDIPCEISLESAMACGIGICQGCPVELRSGEKKYALVCKEGTVFDTKKILLS